MSETETGEPQPIDEGRLGRLFFGYGLQFIQSWMHFLIDTILLFDFFQFIGTPVHYSHFHRLNRGYTICKKLLHSTLYLGTMYTSSYLRTLNHCRYCGTFQTPLFGPFFRQLA